MLEESVHRTSLPRFSAGSLVSMPVANAKSKEASFLMKDAAAVRPQDRETRLKLSDQLYGRDAAIESLLDAFDRTCGGNGEILLIPGKSGIGKTALAEQLREPVRRRNGFFLQGKFNQYFQNVPYFAVRQALAEFCRELLDEAPLRRQQWRDNILGAVDGLGRLLIELAPELENFLGAQPPVPEISPQEAPHRFAKALQGFFQAAGRPEHPLVLFIDDWQWADTASLRLLRQLQLGAGKGYLLVIASYRDDEVGPTHPLVFTLEDLGRQGVPIEVITVNRLTQEEMCRLVADSLLPRVEDLSALADFLDRRTHGNPFFLREFLLFLNEAGWLTYHSRDACWKLSAEGDEQAAIPATIVELFARRIEALPRELRQLLSLAACLGSRFDLETLAIIGGCTADECGKLLSDAQSRQLVVALRESETDAFEFRHDRIQQAAHGLVNTVELPALHLKIGRLLLERFSGHQLADRHFELVEHLNAGCPLVTDVSESLKILELNVLAAHKARSATAYPAMLQFHRAAWRFLVKPGVAGKLWSERHDLAMVLFKGRAESEFLEGDRGEAERCIQLAVEHARTAIEKAATLDILIVQYTLQARYPEAIAAGRKALELLGISLPEDNFEAARDEEIAMVRRQLAGRAVSSLVEMPVMRDAAMSLASRILITMGPPCYRSHQRLWSVIVPKVVNLTLRYGHIPQVGYSHTAFAGLLGWVDSDYTMAREFGDLATQLMAGLFPSPSDQSVFYLMVGSSVRHWFRHLRHGSEDYAEAYEIGLRSGNLQYAAYAFGHNMYCRFYQGIPLGTLIQETQHSLHFSKTRLNQWAIDLLEGGNHLFATLAGDGLAGDAAGGFEADYLDRVEKHHNVQVRCIYTVLKACTLLMFGQYDRALALSDEAQSLIYTVGTQGLLPWPEHRFARFLIISTLCPGAEREQQRLWFAELKEILGQLRQWAEHCPDNFEHKYLLAMAEWERLQHRPGRAGRYYELALEQARAGSFLQWQALTCERAASFWRKQGNGWLEQRFWQKAYDCYGRWGAAAKLLRMEADAAEEMLAAIPDCEKEATDDPFPDYSSAIRERQLSWLRDRVSRSDIDKWQSEVKCKAAELSAAMENLRVEVVQRKRTEEALRESRLWLELALKSARMGAWHFNLIENRRYFDETTCGLLGLDPATFGGNAEEFFAVVHPGDHAAIRDGISLAIEQDRPYEVTYRVVAGGRTIRHIMAHGRIVRDETGRALRLDGLVEDITARKRAEVEREALIRQLQDKTAELERFIYTVSHDLKSPLVTITGFVGFLEDDFASRNEERFSASLSRISQAALRMRQLLDELLEFSRLGLKRNPVEVVNLGTLVAQAVDIVSGRLNEVSAIVKVDPELPEVLVDPQGFRQVFENLLDNAAKFARDAAGGPRIHIGVSQECDDLVCRVTDNGIGIEPRYANKVFDLFEKLDPKSNGTGVGLAIVKRIIEVHEGRIWIEPAGSGGGASFCFTLPAVKRA